MTVIVPVAQCTPRELDELLARRDLVIAVGEGELRGSAAAAALFAGWAVLCDGATIVLDTPAAWAGATWRIGDRAYALWLAGTTELDAHEAYAAGLCDAVVPFGREPVQWVEQWIGTRSELALDSAATLIQRRGGDALESAEFARLFAAGEPQVGLRAFLDKRAPRF
jgi:enoyl-CoA hydratase/carnithine racemase